MNYIHQMLVSKELGGAGLIGIHLARFLRAKGQEYRLWIPGQGAALQKVRTLALEFNLYDASCAFNPSRLNAAVGNWKMWRSLHPYRDGIVHIHSPSHYKAFQLGLGMTGLKTVVHVHLQEGEGGLRWAFEKPPDVIITCARMLEEHVRRTLPERYQKHQRIVSIPNAIDTDRFSPGDKAGAKQKVGAPASIPVVLMVANLAPHKGQETAIRATAELKKEGIEIACWLAGIERHGEGNYTARLHRLADELGVADRVRFLGHREDVPDLLRAADIFLLPSTSEGLPLSVLEAQATKIPVLAAPTAGIPEVIRDGETGFLIPAPDATVYAHRIKSLLNQRETYQSMTEKAYTKVTQDHNWQTYFENTLMVYQSLM